MQLTVENVQEFTLLVARHPEWQAELRRLVLTDELLELPNIVRRLAEAQEHAEKRLGRAEERLDRIEERLGRVEDRLDGVEERLDRLTAVVTELAEAQKRTELRIQELTTAQLGMETILNRLVDRVAKHTGQLMEMAYRDNAYAYFGTLLRNIRVVPLQSLEEKLEENLSAAELEELAPLDLLIRGLPRGTAAAIEIHLAIEVSSVVDKEDVDRAHRRAHLLQGRHSCRACCGRRERDRGRRRRGGSQGRTPGVGRQKEKLGSGTRPGADPLMGRLAASWGRSRHR